MDFIKAKTGLTSKNGEFRLLYIVTVSQFEAWTQKSDTHFQAWI